MSAPFGTALSDRMAAHKRLEAHFKIDHPSTQLSLSLSFMGPCCILEMVYGPEEPDPVLAPGVVRGPDGNAIAIDGPLPGAVLLCQYCSPEVKSSGQAYHEAECPVLAIRELEATIEQLEGLFGWMASRESLTISNASLTHARWMVTWGEPGVDEAEGVSLLAAVANGMALMEAREKG